MEELFNEMDKKGLKVTFGLQPDQIELIESKFINYPSFKYNTTIWNDIGKEIGWCPLTAALYYFRYLENRIDSGSSSTVFIDGAFNMSYGEKLYGTSPEARACRNKRRKKES